MPHLRSLPPSPHRSGIAPGPPACFPSAGRQRGGPFRRRLRLIAAASAALAGAAGAHAAPAGRAHDTEPPNVLLVVLDTVGARHVGGFAPGLTGTPTLERLAREGVAFRRAYSPAPWTQPAVASLLTSRMPSAHGFQGLHGVLAEESVTLAEELRARGYQTGAVVSHFLLAPRHGFAQGFDRYDDSPAGTHETVSSPQVTAAALAWLAGRDRKRPFFLLAHYFDAHAVYQEHGETAPAGDYAGPIKPGMGIWELRDLRPVLTPVDIGRLRDLYRGEIAFVDRSLGRLVAGLRGIDPGRDTMVVVTADHGEELMEHGWIGHTRTLYDELLHVPLLFWSPGRLPPRAVEAPVSLLDVLPTLVEIAGGPAHREEWEGTSLVATLAGRSTVEERPLFAEVSFSPEPDEPPQMAEKTAFKTALRQGSLKLVHDLPTDGWELYDLATDPLERVDLAPRHRLLRSLQRTLLDWQRQRPSPAPPPPLDDEERERLRSLGYVGR